MKTTFFITTLLHTMYTRHVDKTSLHTRYGAHLGHFPVHKPLLLLQTSIGTYYWNNIGTSRTRDLDDGRIHQTAATKFIHDEKDAVGEAQVPIFIYILMLVPIFYMYVDVN